MWFMTENILSASAEDVLRTKTVLTTLVNSVPISNFSEIDIEHSEHFIGFTANRAVLSNTLYSTAWYGQD